MPGYGGSGGGGYTPGLAIEDIQTTENRIKLLQRYVPEIGQDAHASFNMATQYADDQTMLRAALQTQSFVKLERDIENLRAGHGEWQRAYFASLPAALQERYVAQGYEVPKPHKDDGFFHFDLPGELKLGPIDLLGTLGPGEGIGRIPGLIGATGAGLVETAGAVLDAFGSVPRAITRGYRTLEYSGDRNVNLLDAWDRVDRGETVFNEGAETRAQDLLGNDWDVSVAKTLAAGDDAKRMLEGMGLVEGTPEFNKGVLTFYETTAKPNFEEAVRSLMLGKMSLGRWVADFLPGDRSMPGGMTAYNVVSGAIDGAIQFIDPSLVVGPALKARQAAAWGIKVSDVASINRFRLGYERYRLLDDEAKAFLVLRDPAAARGRDVGAMAELVAEAFRGDVPAVSELTRLQSDLTPIIGDLETYHQMRKTFGDPGLADPMAFFDFIADTEGRLALGTSRASGYGRNTRIVPHITAAGAAKMRTKAWFSSKIDELALDKSFLRDQLEMVEREEMLLTPDVAEDIRSAVNKPRAVQDQLERLGLIGELGSRALSRGAEGLMALLNHVPREKVINLSSPEAFAEFDRLARSGALLAKMPRSTVYRVVDEFAAGNEAQKLKLLRSTLADMLTLGGADASEVDHWIGNLFRFSADERLDTIVDDAGREMHVALNPGEHNSWQFAIPGFRPLMEATRNRNLMQHTVGSSVWGSFDAATSRFWKPAVLLRGGFIARAYGEEMLQFVLANPMLSYPIAKIHEWKYDDLPIWDTTRMTQVREAFALESGQVSAFDFVKAGREDWTENIYAALSEAEMMALRPISWSIHSVASMMERLGVEQLSRTTSALDNMVQYSAAWASGYIKPGMLVVPRYAKDRAVAFTEWRGGIDPDRMEVLRLMHDKDSIVAKALLDQLQGGFYFDADSIEDTLGRYAQQRVVIKKKDPSTGEMADVEMMQDTSNFRHYQAAGDAFDEEYYGMAHMVMHKQQVGPLTRAGLGEMRRHIDERTAELVQHLAQGTTLAGVDGAETLTNALKYVRQLSGRTRNQLLKALSPGGDLDSLDAVLARLTNDGVADFFRAAVNDPSLRAKLRSGVDRPFVISTPELRAQKIQQAMAEALQRPENAKFLRENIRAIQMKDGRPVAQPVKPGHTPVYVPMLPRTMLDQLAAMGPEATDEFRRMLPLILGRHGLAHRSDELADIVLPGGDVEDLRNLGARVAIWKGEDYVPVTRWGSTNAEMAESVSKAMAIVLGQSEVKGIYGLRQLPDETVRLAGQTKPARVWRMEQGGTGAIATSSPDWRSADSLFLDDAHLFKVDVVDPDVRTIVDGQTVPGVPMAEALREWTTDLAADLMRNMHSPRDGRMLDQLIVPSSEGKFKMENLHEVAPGDLPVVVGPELVMPKEQNWWDRGVRKGFDDFIGPAGASIIRNVRFQDEAVAAYKELKPLINEVFLRQDLADDVRHLVNTKVRAERVGGGRQVTDMDTLYDAWRHMPKALTQVNAKPQNVNEILFGRTGLDFKDPALRQVQEYPGWAAGKTVISTGDDGEMIFDRKLYGMLMRGRREGTIPYPSYYLSGPELHTLRSWANNVDLVRTQLWESVATRTWTNIAPFIDDRRFRSQFQETIGTLIPFQFAEEQFLKRWARTFTHSPEAVYKAQLGMNGLRSMGWIQEDPRTGESVFVYPGSTLLINALGKASTAIFGTGMLATIPSSFTGQLRFTLPGLDGKVPGVPNVGPFVGAVVTEMANIFPELGAAERGILGPQSEGKEWFSYFVPATANNLYNAMYNTERLTGAAIQAMAYLEANGKGPREGATPREVEEWKDDVRHWARGMLFAQALTGFMGPAAPQLKAAGIEVRAEYQELLQNVPIEDATRIFMERFPNGKPYTVSPTRSVSGAPLPFTEEALGWMEENDGYLRSFAKAAPYLLPQPVGDRFERRAYYQQVALGLRERKSVDEWYEEAKYSEAADDYFDMRNLYEAQLQVLGADDVQGRKDLTDRYSAFKSTYLVQHPLFADMLRRTDRVEGRGDILDEMRLIVADPTAPDSPHLEQMRILMTSFDNYLTRVKPLTGDRRRVVSEYKAEQKDSFWRYAESLVVRYPALKSFYQRVILPELDVDFDHSGEIAPASFQTAY